MIPHGWGKFKRLMEGLQAREVQFYDWMVIGTAASLALAVMGELVAPAFVVLGPFTRWMSIPAAITMAVAAFGDHAGDPIFRQRARASFPGANRGFGLHRRRALCCRLQAKPPEVKALGNPQPPIGNILSWGRFSSKSGPPERSSRVRPVVLSRLRFWPWHWLLWRALRPPLVLVPH